MTRLLQKQSFLFLAVFAPSLIMGQESKVLKGKVQTSSQDNIGIVVRNVNQNYATVTDINGEFTIRAKLRDTLVFSAVQLKRKVIPVSEAVFNSSFIVISLEEFVNELDEVVLKPYNLSGNLNEDLFGLELPMDVSAEALGLPNADYEIPTQSENKLNDADHGKFVYFYGVGFAINVNKILNRISGRTKMLKHRVLLDKEYETVQHVEGKFLESQFLDFLKIPEGRFYDFMHYCQVDTNFDNMVQQKDDLALWQFIIEKSKAYKQENHLD